MISPDTIVVLIPDEWGDLVVCPLDQLVDKVMESGDDRGQLLAAIASDAAIDSFNLAAAREGMVAKVRRLNETGDPREYWGSA